MLEYERQHTAKMHACRILLPAARMLRVRRDLCFKVSLESRPGHAVVAFMDWKAPEDQRQGQRGTLAGGHLC